MEINISQNEEPSSKSTDKDNEQNKIAKEISGKQLYVKKYSFIFNIISVLANILCIGYGIVKIITNCGDIFIVSVIFAFIIIILSLNDFYLNRNIKIFYIIGLFYRLVKSLQKQEMFYNISGLFVFAECIISFLIMYNSDKKTYCEYFVSHSQVDTEDFFENIDQVWQQNDRTIKCVEYTETYSGDELQNKIEEYVNIKFINYYKQQKQNVLIFTYLWPYFQNYTITYSDITIQELDQDLILFPFDELSIVYIIVGLLQIIYSLSLCFSQIHVFDPDEPLEQKNSLQQISNIRDESQNQTLEPILFKNTKIVTRNKKNKLSFLKEETEIVEDKSSQLDIYHQQQQINEVKDLNDFEKSDDNSIENVRIEEYKFENNEEKNPIKITIELLKSKATSKDSYDTAGNSTQEYQSQLHSTKNEADNLIIDQNFLNIQNKNSVIRKIKRRTSNIQTLNRVQQMNLEDDEKQIFK